MSLNFGPRLLSIPGPSVMPERVLRAMHRASPNIYEGELVEMTTTLFPDLKAVARTEHYVAMYIANGHGAWEAALKNTIQPGERVLVLCTGRFGAGWGEVAKSLGIEIEAVDFGMHSDADPNVLEEKLRADTDRKIKAVLTVQTDTASSVINNVPALRAAIDNANHDALYMVDCIASLGCDRFEMDAWNVDVMMAGCQKGLMTPAGMSFVYFNEKADAARKNCEPGFYWDWVPRTRPEQFYQQFAGTAPTHHLYGLREALDILVHEEGVEQCWSRHQTIAQAVWAAVDVWGQGGGLQHNIEDRAKRSVAVSTIATNVGDAKRIRAWTEHQGGVTLGIGLGFGEPGSDEWNRRFRIGHMGHQNVATVMGTLSAIDIALKAHKIDHGSGALEAAALALSKYGTEVKAG